MTWHERWQKVEHAVLRHPVWVVFGLLLASTLATPGRSYVGATIWLVTSGVVLIWRYGVLREKYPDLPRSPGLLHRWRNLRASLWGR